MVYINLVEKKLFLNKEIKVFINESTIGYENFPIKIKQRNSQNSH